MRKSLLIFTRSRIKEFIEFLSKNFVKEKVEENRNTVRKK